MSEVSKIGILLTFIFSFFSLALFAEILYLLFFRRRSSVADHPAGKPTAFLPIFLRRKKQHSGRVEPSSAPVTAHPAAEAPPDEAELEMAELLKLQNSRLLYTIKEEEREGSADWSSERSASLGDHRRRTLTAGESTGKCTAAAAEAGHESVCSDQTTPFTTPCASPTYYYSPSPSPERETNCVASGGGKWSPEI